jgi:predicted GIY-YIG superfamily endonuclease
MAKNPPGKPGLMPASASQLRLIPSARPLEGRLGAGFFRQLPRRPGVYRMLGADGALLYVGKAGDLRQRLSSYRSLTHASRKTVRLLHAVHAITWEVCATEEAAARLENELLRTHRPRFNRVGVWPQANGYLEMVCSGDDLRLRFLRTPAGEAAAQDEKLIPGHLGVSSVTQDQAPPLTLPRSRGGTLSRRTGICANLKRCIFCQGN